MRKSRYTEEQIVGFLKESEAGMATAELCRKHGISEQTFYRWKAKYGGLEVGDAQRLRQLEEENRKLKQLMAEQPLDIVGFKAVLSKSGMPSGQAGGRGGISGRGGVLETTCLWAVGSAAYDGSLSSAGGALCRSQPATSGTPAGVGRRAAQLGIPAAARSSATGRLDREQQAGVSALRGREADGAQTQAEKADLRSGSSVVGSAGAEERDLDDGFSPGCIGLWSQGSHAVDRGRLHAGDAGHRG
jgi:putative transposase